MSRYILNTAEWSFRIQVKSFHFFTWNLLMVPRALKIKVQVLPKTCRAREHQSLTHPHRLTMSPLTLLARSILTICLSGPFLHCVSTWFPHFMPPFPSENPSLATLYKTNLTFTTSQWHLSLMYHTSTYLLSILQQVTLTARKWVKDFLWFATSFLLPRTVPGTQRVCTKYLLSEVIN